MKWRAFTLIELLVVIGIIALLVSILVPVLQRSRQNAKAVHCSSNIKQLFLGLTLYENENETFPLSLDTDNDSPPPGGYPGNIMYDRSGWWWFNYIIDFIEQTYFN